MKTETQTSLVAFHGDAKIKAKYLARVRGHRAADEIINGQYWELGKGCAVGCTIHSGYHASYETEIGVPRVLAFWEDGIFERLFPVDRSAAKEWPERFLLAIKVGADLSRVYPKFALWMLTDEKFGFLPMVKSEQVREAIRAAAELFREWSIGEKPAAIFWERARTELSNIWLDARAAIAALAALAARDARAARAALWNAAAGKLIELLTAAE